MRRTLPDVPAPDDLIAPAPDALRGALLESRQRWRDFVCLVADLAFETDERGRFTFVHPDTVLGWSAGTLVGQPTELLAANTAPSGGFSPFRPNAVTRRRRAWVKRADGSLCCMSFFAAPLFDDAGRIVGARGIGLDVTENSADEEQTAAALRRGEVLDHVLWRMRQEVLAPRMMHAALDALMRAVGAEGAAILGPVPEQREVAVLHQVGAGAETVLPVAASMLASNGSTASGLTPEARPVIACACNASFRDRVGLALWRRPHGRAWNLEEQFLVSASSSVVRVILEHEAIQNELALQARTDPLTGLLNRRAFLDEIERNIARLEREQLPGTLMFVDLDHFKALNDRCGHEVGDEALLTTAELLRNMVRPTDLVARFGGDEFAVWLNGADHLTAAERAEWLRVHGPRSLSELTDGKSPPLTMSVGIATRSAGSPEEVSGVMRRADQAMYEVKRGGRGHWVVAPETGICR